MDKRWRNLGIILIVFIILVLIFTQSSQFIVQEKISFEDAVYEMDTIVESNGVDVYSFKTLILVSIEDGKMIENVSENQMLSLKNDLVEYNATLQGMIIEEDLEDTLKIASLYIIATDITEAKRALFSKTEEFVSSDLINDCGQYDLIDDLTLDAEIVYLDVADLYLEDSDIYFNNDLEGTVFNVDLAYEEAMLEYYHYNIAYFEGICDYLFEGEQ